MECIAQWLCCKNPLVKNSNLECMNKGNDPEKYVLLNVILFFYLIWIRTFVDWNYRNEIGGKFIEKYE